MGTEYASFEARISDMQRQVTLVTQDMELLCQQFVVATEKTIVLWTELEIYRARHERPQVICDMSMENIRAFKQELQQLQSALPGLVQGAINHDQLWAHRQQQGSGGQASHGRYLRSGKKPPVEMDAAVRGLMGHWGQILISRRLATPGEQWDSQTSPPKYTGVYEWSEKMITTLERYAGMYEKLTRLRDTVTDLTLRKLRLQADEKWASA